MAYIKVYNNQSKSKRPVHFYHGTISVKLPELSLYEVGDKLLPPYKTGNLRETPDIRDRQTNDLMHDVYITTSMKSARYYAKMAQLAAKALGHDVNPVVFEVTPHHDSLICLRDNEYTCNWATIKRVIKI